MPPDPSTPPERYEYREEDMFFPLYAEEIRDEICTRFRIGQTIYYTRIHPLIKPLMRCRTGPESARPTLLRYQLEEMIYRWQINGFPTSKHRTKGRRYRQ